MLARLQDLATGVSAALRLHGTLIKLDAEANRDPLTALGNRRAFDRRLSDTVMGWTLLLLDLDGFKAINDLFGHPAGDQALREVADRLRAAMRQAEFVFRLGGDEFAVLLPSALSRDDCSALAARIHAVLADTFMLDGNVVPLRASIGVAILPAGRTDPAVSIMDVADAALYDAKRSGRDTTRFADCLPSSAPTASPDSGRARRDLEGRLRRALIPPGAEPFTLAFQAVTDARKGEVTGFEALIRWSPKGEALLSPAEFIPLAERTGLVTYIDSWVLRHACETAVGWSKPWRVGVNISAITFGIADLVAMVTETLAATGLAPQRLVIEMTETAFVADEERVRSVMQRLHALGVRIALDDFGGGHGSLTALRRFPFSTIKIDRALITGVDTDLVGGKTVKFIAELGALVGIDVIAEGVERPEELIALGEYGVFLAQGYLLSQPVAAGGIEAAVRRAEQVALLRRVPSRDSSWTRPIKTILPQSLTLGSSQAMAASAAALSKTTNSAP